MASKLDVYQIILGKRAGLFKDVICKKCGITETSPAKSKVFNAFYKKFLELIGTNVFCVDAKKMGLTIFKERGQRINKVMTAHSDSFVIEGYIDGGPYDTIRKLAKLSDTSKRQTINKTDIVTDRYYIYLYLPLNSKMGVLMVQTKENSSIRRAIKPFFETLFKTDSTKNCRINSYYPKWLKEDFLQGANLHNMSFETENISQAQSEEELTIETETFNVKITITPTNDQTAITDATTATNRIGRLFALKIGDVVKPLSSFTKKKGTMKNEEQKKSLPFVIDEEDNIHPVIEIDNDLTPDENGDYGRDNLKIYCDSLLNRIKPEIYGIDHG